MRPVEAWRLLGTANVATLATQSLDGSARLVPVVFAVVDSRRLVTAVDHKPKTTRRLARLTDILRQPQVTLLAHNYEDDWDQLWWVRVKGIAEVMDTVDPKLAEPLVDKYEQYRKASPEGPWIVIDVEAIKGWSAAGDA